MNYIDDARAKAIYEALYPVADGWVPWDDAPKDRHDLCRRADRAGFVPPMSKGRRQVTSTIGKAREALSIYKSGEFGEADDILKDMAWESAEELVKLHDKFAELADDLERETRMLGIVGLDDRIEQATLDIRETLEGDNL